MGEGAGHVRRRFGDAGRGEAHDLLHAFGGFDVDFKRLGSRAPSGSNAGVLRVHASTAIQTPNPKTQTPNLWRSRPLKHDQTHTLLELKLHKRQQQRRVRAGQRVAAREHEARGGKEQNAAREKAAHGSPDEARRE